MKRFKNILLIAENGNALRGSAAEKAREQARLNDARLKVIGVVEEGMADFFSSRIFGNTAGLRMQGIENLENELKQALAEPEWRNKRVELEILQGTPFISVIQQVINHGFDLVVKQNNETEGVDNLAMRLLRKCPCPIWLIRADDSRQFRRVLAAVDLSKNDDATAQLNRKILELAYSLAQREGGEAHYLFAWYVFTESRLRGPRFNWGDNELVRFKANIIKQSRQEMQSLFDIIQIQPADERVHIVEGKTETIIHRMIAEKEIDLLVMGTVGRAGIPGLLIGNTAENIVKNVRCSLMAVKPDGFVSPVN